MYEESQTQPHVVDEDWFENKDDDTGEITRRLATKTIQRCLRKPNRSHRLSTADIRLVKAHVDAVKTGCIIHYIKRVETRTRNQDTEFVHFQGHISSSKYSFSSVIMTILPEPF